MVRPADDEIAERTRRRYDAWTRRGQAVGIAAVCSGFTGQIGFLVSGTLASVSPLGPDHYGRAEDAALYAVDATHRRHRSIP